MTKKSREMIIQEAKETPEGRFRAMEKVLNDLGAVTKEWDELFEPAQVEWAQPFPTLEGVSDLRKEGPSFPPSLMPLVVAYAFAWCAVIQQVNYSEGDDVFSISIREDFLLTIAWSTEQGTAAVPVDLRESFEWETLESEVQDACFSAFGRSL